jgi:xanthine dehydrogenase large subunit
MMNNIDSELHVRGETTFVDDLPLPEHTLHAAVFASPLAHGRIDTLNISIARSIPGVVAVFTAKDIPGENQIGNIILDEPLLAESDVDFIGQPIAIVVADKPETARKGVRAIEATFEEKPAILDARQAYECGQLFAPPRTFVLGDVSSQWAKCDLVVEGRVDSGGQEHLYLETQTAIALPVENGCIKIISATQSASAVQRIVARVLGLAMQKIEVEVPRLGGAFGGKEDQATPWACMAALAAFVLKKPVKITLRRHEDMIMTGKRHPYSSDFKLGLAKDGRFVAYKVTLYQNGGAATDLSTAILERSLFHVTGSYYIPNVKATAISCRTNLAPNTAFRGFGAPQAMFVLESAIHKAAQQLGVEAAVLQQKNLLRENDEFPYGMQASNCHARLCWEQSEDRYQIRELQNRVEAFNRSSSYKKKGWAMMPVCFGISFTSTPLNQASALVHVFTDGSVSITTSAVEMGQGVKSKIQHIAARTLSIHPDRIKIEMVNTTRVANMSPTAASTGADMNGNAAKLACEQILARLKKVATDILNVSYPEFITIRDEIVFYNDQQSDLRWEKLVSEAYLSRVNLSAHVHYATPNLFFDRETAKGRPFAYHVYGTACLEVTVDCLRGIYSIDNVCIVHDVGQSLNPSVDLGQVEGAVAQGIGWITIEELMHDDKGKLLTDSLSTYKVPDIFFAPKEMQVHFLPNVKNEYGPYFSKAVGEPPLMYGIGVYFAILNAMKAFRPDMKAIYSAPLTPERVLMRLYDAHGCQINPPLVSRQKEFETPGH